MVRHADQRCNGIRTLNAGPIAVKLQGTRVPANLAQTTLAATTSDELSTRRDLNQLNQLDLMKPQRSTPPTRPIRGRLCNGQALLWALVLLMPAPGVGADQPATIGTEQTGEQIYRWRCESCHGANGEGGSDYPNPLVGTRSVGQLARFIQQSMPKDDDDKCTSDEADRVAAYIHQAFYSPLAQARHRPARIDLSRLTVRQLRHSVTDLIGSYSESPIPDERRGATGQYFKSRHLRGDARITERIDPTICFDFGDRAPAEGEFDLHQFSIRWQGSILAPDTGEYEFQIRTDHAVRLWINDDHVLLIDGWVKSGTDPVYRESLYLLGGRAYPFKLEFSKAKQGVDDSDKNKDKPPAIASIDFQWRRPTRSIFEVVPQQYLFPLSLPERFVMKTAFPPDDRSIGYERGSSVSPEWDHATTEGAIETANFLARRWRELSHTDEGSPEQPIRAREFCARFVETAFRQPLTDEIRTQYVDRHFASDVAIDASVKRVALLTVKSPRFLYPELEVSDSYRVAARLALVLWDSLPDESLRQAAAANDLASVEQMTRHAERMVADPRAVAKLREFLLQWLRVSPPPDLEKDGNAFPGFDAELISDLRTSFEMSIDEFLRRNPADFRQLFLHDSWFVNGRMATFYGWDLPADAAFQRLRIASPQRVGILTHPYLMASFAYRQQSSPIHRGVFVARGLFGRRLQPPPDAFVPVPAELHPDLTTRERVSLQTQPDACKKCHGLINPLGFPFEHLDAVGRIRETEKEKPINSSGHYLSLTGDAATFAGPVDLARFVAQSEETHAAFIEQLFHHLAKQPLRAYGADVSEELRQSFSQHEFDLRKTVIEMAVLYARYQNHDLTPEE